MMHSSVTTTRYSETLFIPIILKLIMALIKCYYSNQVNAVRNLYFSCRDIGYDITQLYNMHFSWWEILSDCITVVNSLTDYSVHIDIHYSDMSLNY